MQRPLVVSPLLFTTLDIINDDGDAILIVTVKVTSSHQSRVHAELPCRYLALLNIT